MRPCNLLYERKFLRAVKSSVQPIFLVEGPEFDVVVVGSLQIMFVSSCSYGVDLYVITGSV